MLLHSLSGHAAEMASQVSGIDQPDADGLTVRNLVASLDFQRMGQRVSVVQQCSASGLALVARNEFGFDLDTASNALLLVHRQQIVAGQEVVLRHFAAAAAQLSWWQCR